MIGTLPGKFLFIIRSLSLLLVFITCMSHDTWGQIQVLQFKLVDESMTICGDSARVMIEFRKTTNDPVTGIQVELIPYRGMTYLPDSYQNYDGDATGDNGDPDNPLLFFPDLNGSAGETLRDTFEMKIGCQLLPLMANEKVLIGGNVLADGGIEAKATDIEVQLLQPALNLISIVNKVTD